MKKLFEKFNAFMEKHFVPVAAKIGSQRHLVVVRDSFIGILPVTMAGSVAVLLNVFFRDLPTAWSQYAIEAGNPGLGNVFLGFVSFMTPVIGVNGSVWWASNAVLSLVFAFSLGYNMAKSYDVNPLAGGLITFSALIATIPQMATFEATIAGVTESVSGWGYLPYNYTQITGLFSSLIVGFIASLIYCKLMVKRVTINLPDSVPPAVSAAFASIIPGVISIYLVAITANVVTTFTGKTINDFIQYYVQQPLLGLSQSLISVIIITLLVQIFWFFGLHGSNVLAPIIDGIYRTALYENTAAFNNGTEFEYIWTRGSFDAFVWMGGAGCTLALIVALFIFSKREDQKTIAKLSAPMGIFNINEPIVFGLPLVLNPIYIIPFTLVPIVLTIIAYFATSIGLVPPVYVDVTWVMPPVFYAFLATGGNIMAALLSIVNFVIAVVLWAPFVIMANKLNLDD
ncbi:MAG: PTS transporter subunit EIIC [Clostridia bacterium]